MCTSSTHTIKLWVLNTMVSLSHSEDLETKMESLVPFLCHSTVPESVIQVMGAICGGIRLKPLNTYPQCQTNCLLLCGNFNPSESLSLWVSKSLCLVSLILAPCPLTHVCSSYGMSIAAATLDLFSQRTFVCLARHTVAVVSPKSEGNWKVKIHAELQLSASEKRLVLKVCADSCVD